jgi:uncharacterized repeat protein (TIGR03803 family)
MTNPAQRPLLLFAHMVRARIARGSLPTLALICVLIAPVRPMHAQTFTVIHNFTGGLDGGVPQTGLTIDSAGNLYGTTVGGGNIQSDSCFSVGCGVVFKLAHHSSGWLLTPIYTFQGNPDGAAPCSRITIASNGTLYGTTNEGGGTQCSQGGSCLANLHGCGTIFNLAPPSHSSGGALAPWTETVLYRFTGGSDGSYPAGDLAFDSAGNLNGAATSGGTFGGECGTQLGCGTVYQLAQSGTGWVLNVLHSFSALNDGLGPQGGVTLDSAGSVYGTTKFDSNIQGPSCGTVFQLTPSGSGWESTILHWFGRTQGDGCFPIAGLIVDSAGNLYGGTPWVYQGQPAGSGEVYKFASTHNGWDYSVIFDFFDDGHGGLGANLMMDSAGNLYGTTGTQGAYGYGSVFKLTPRGGVWAYTSLHDFTGGVDGGTPRSSLVQDSAGNLYGTAATGGTRNKGVVFEITP